MRLRYVSEEHYFFQTRIALREARQNGLDDIADGHRDEIEGIALCTEQPTIRRACRQALAEDIGPIGVDRVGHLIV